MTQAPQAGRGLPTDSAPPPPDPLFSPLKGGGVNAEAVGARHTRLRFARPASTSGFRKTSSTSSRSPIRPQSRE